MELILILLFAYITRFNPFRIMGREFFLQNGYS